MVYIYIIFQGRSGQWRLNKFITFFQNIHSHHKTENLFYPTLSFPCIPGLYGEVLSAILPGRMGAPPTFVCVCVKCKYVYMGICLCISTFLTDNTH